MMAKTMEELYKEEGPQGWVDDPPDPEDPNTELIEELEDYLNEIDEELEDIEAQKEALDEREDDLLDKARKIEKKLKALRGDS